MNTQRSKSSVFSIIILLLFFVAGGCGKDQTEDDSHDNSEGRLESTEHSRESEGDRQGAAHDENGEEDGTEYSLDQTYDELRLGTRLILNYDAESNSFHGSVENASDEPLHNVRVEVHLSNGVELGPTERVDLMPGQKQEVRLQAESQDFAGFTAHAEVGGSGQAGEHSGEEGEEH